MATHTILQLPNPAIRPTLEEFFRLHWSTAIEPLLRPSTARVYQIVVKHHILPVFGQKFLCDIRRIELQTFLLAKRTHGLSPSAVHGLKNALSKVLQAAVDWGYLAENPVKGLRVGNREPVRERFYLLPGQVRELLGALPKPCRVVVSLAVLTGLRIGELLALRWKHIDLERGLILVRESVSEGRFGLPKTRASRRDIPISDRARRLLLGLRATGATPDALLFVSRNRTPLNPKNMLNRLLRPACKSLGLPTISWHSFRHTNATLLGESGESLKTAQALLGHSHLETTLNIYTHPIPESQRRAVESVAAMIFPKAKKRKKKDFKQRG